MSSKAMVFGSETALSVVHFIKFSITIALKIEANFKALFPEYYELYKEAFDASVFYSDDPGPCGITQRQTCWSLWLCCVDGLGLHTGVLLIM